MTFFLTDHNVKKPLLFVRFILYNQKLKFVFPNDQVKPKRFLLKKDKQKRMSSLFYYRLVRLLENFISLIPGIKMKKTVARVLSKVRFFSGNIFLEVTKPC